MPPTVLGENAFKSFVCSFMWNISALSLFWKKNVESQLEIFLNVKQNEACFCAPFQTQGPLLCQLTVSDTLTSLIFRGEAMLLWPSTSLTEALTISSKWQSSIDGYRCSARLHSEKCLENLFSSEFRLTVCLHQCNTTHKQPIPVYSPPSKLGVANFSCKTITEQQSKMGK